MSMSKAAAMHYYLVALFILVHTAPEDEAHLLAKLDFIGHYHPSKPDQLTVLAAEISGIAFTAKTPAVIVNAFGPIAYCNPRHASPLMDRVSKTDFTPSLQISAGQASTGRARKTTDRLQEDHRMARRTTHRKSQGRMAALKTETPDE